LEKIHENPANYEAKDAYGYQIDNIRYRVIVTENVKRPYQADYLDYCQEQANSTDNENTDAEEFK
jgi:hypothetical protein